MKILKLLNSNYLTILLIIFLLSFSARGEDKPIDIWDIDQSKVDETNSDSDLNNKENDGEQKTQSNIYDLQSQKEIDTVLVDSSLTSQEVKILGLYDPEDYDLKLDLWANSNGDQLKYLFTNLTKLNLS